MPAAETYQVKLDIFEGPLDLLLYLVRQEEVELYDLSLERLTRQYLDYLGNVAQPDLDLAGDFVAMAAHLIYLKSRRLLPPEQQPEGAEEPEDDDPRWELIRQLVEYKKFKDAAGYLQAVETARRDLFTRPSTRPPEPSGEDEAAAGVLAMADLGLLDLLNAFQRLLRRLEEKQPEARTIFEENYTVADKIERLRALIDAARGSPVLFFDLFDERSSRLEMVVTFLALLELVRLKHLRIAQSAAFAEVVVTRQETPHGLGEPPPSKSG